METKSLDKKTEINFASLSQCQSSPPENLDLTDFLT